MWVFNPCTKFEHDKTYRSRVRTTTVQFSIDRQLKVPIFTFFEVKGVNFKFNLSNPQKALPWRERRLMMYWTLGCVQKCDLWAWRRNEKKGQKLSCVKLAICPDHPRRRRPLKFCMRGRVLEVVIYFKFHENRLRGLRAVEGRKSPSPIDLAYGLYNSLYYRTSRDYSTTKAYQTLTRLSVAPIRLNQTL